MTFKESEHTDILEKLFEMSNRDLPMDEIVKETWRLVGRIPLYPGIVVGCMGSIPENVKPEEIQKGDFIVVYDKEGNRVSGIIEKKDNNKVILKDATLTKKLKSEDMKLDRNERVVRFRKNILEKSWPSLIFDGKEDKK